MNALNFANSPSPWPGARELPPAQARVRLADKFFGAMTLLARILRCSRGQTRAEVVDRLAIFALSSHFHLRRMPPLSRKPLDHGDGNPKLPSRQYASGVGIS